MIISENAGKVAIERKFPCAICRKNAGSKSNLCQFCRCWVRNRGSGIRGKLEEDSKFKACTRYYLSFFFFHQMIALEKL